MPLRVYLSADNLDAQTATDLARLLSMAFQPESLVFWDAAGTAPEAFRAESAKFLESADLFVAVLSMNYEDRPDTRWEAGEAVRISAENPALQIAWLQARKTVVPQIFRPYASALPAGESIEDQPLARDKQLSRAALHLASIYRAGVENAEPPRLKIDLPLLIDDVKERLQAQTDRINHAPQLALLKRMIEQVLPKRVVLDIEDVFKHLREKTRLSQISIEELKSQSRTQQIELQHLIADLKENDLTSDWRSVFIRDYFHFTSESRETTDVPPFFVPAEEVVIPDTLNLPVGPREEESLEQIGLLSFEQKTEFRRRLLLARDALAVRQYAQAYTHCDFVRTQIDPQSAQLYEYLLITYLQMESAEKVMREAAAGNNKFLHHVQLFATRLKDYQKANKCPTSTGVYNLSIASEGLSDAALRMYYRYPNDPLLHTGKNLEQVADNRKELRILLDNMLKICRLVHPSEELLEAAVVEICGGGKYNWVQRIDVQGEHFRFFTIGQFDLLGEIRELLDLIQSIEDSEPGKIVKDAVMLREDLYYSLNAKRQVFLQQIEAEVKRRRPFTDIRQSVIHFVYACILGQEVFGNLSDTPTEQSFHRMALEFLLPDLLLQPFDIGPVAELEWFTFDAEGLLTAHPDCAGYRFDVQAIVEKMMRDYSMGAGGHIVLTNIREAVYKRYTDETKALYSSIESSLQFTDFRRPDPLDVRRRLIKYLDRLLVQYKAYPELGEDFLDAGIRELSGQGAMLWLIHDPHNLTTHPDALGLEFDARACLQSFLRFSKRFTEESLRPTVAESLFERRILPAYEALKPEEESLRTALITLIKETISGYQLYPNFRYIDLIYKELTEEIKLKWINIDENGYWTPLDLRSTFDPTAWVEKFCRIAPQRYNLLEARKQIAERRHHDQVERYFHEISEFRRENRRPERAIVVDIIQKMAGIFYFMPNEEYLRLPLAELLDEGGNGRIRWYAWFLGIFPLPWADHYENQFFNYNYEKYKGRFKYRFVVDHLKLLRDTRSIRMERVLSEIKAFEQEAV